MAIIISMKTRNMMPPMGMSPSTQLVSDWGGGGGSGGGVGSGDGGDSVEKAPTALQSLQVAEPTALTFQ